MDAADTPKTAPLVALPLILRGMYARPLYVFSGDKRGTFILDVRPMDPDALQQTNKKFALDTWVFSMYFHIGDGEAGVRALLDACERHPDQTLASWFLTLYTKTGSAGVVDAFPVHALLLEPGQMVLRDLRLALRDAAALANAPLSRDEEVRALLQCPYVLLNWVVSFGTHRPGDYIELCASGVDPNWMHALIADIGHTEGAPFHAPSRACVLALNTEAVLVRAGDPTATAIPLNSIHGTPRCLYCTLYMTPQHDAALTVAGLQKAFEADAAYMGTRRMGGREIHATRFLAPETMRALRFALLSKHAPGMTELFATLDCQLPTNQTVYYDCVCHAFHQVLTDPERAHKMFVLYAKSEDAAGQPFAAIGIMPKFRVDTVEFDLPMCQTALEPYSQAQVPMLLMATLSSLVASQFRVTPGHGTLLL